MKKRWIFRIALLVCLCLCVAGCAASPAEEAVPTASPTAAPTAAPTATPTAAPTAEPTPEPKPIEVTVEVESMYPLLQAHVLAQLNGGTFSADDPTYFWQTVSFAMDHCGMDFYSAETVGSALMLSRGVIEEIASGLFEGGGEVLLEIPAALEGEIQYDTEADAFAHPLGEGNFSIAPVSLTESEDGVLTLTAQFFSGSDAENAITSFTAELVPNARTGNSLFTLSVRSLSLHE